MSMMIDLLSAPVRPVGEEHLSEPVMLLLRALFLLPLILLGGFFAGTETALLSLSMAERESLSQQSLGNSDAAASRILWLLGNPRRLITTLILGNEVINISISSLVTELCTRLMGHLPASVSRAAHDDAVIAVVATLCAVPLLILFGELIPKTIGIKLSLRWARLCSAPTVFVTWLLWLPRTVISALSNAVLFLFLGKARNKEPSSVLRELEFRTLVDLGSAEGEIEGTERRLIHNVFEFGDLTVGKVMTPADKVFALSVDMPLQRLVDAVSKERYSRVPLYRVRRDNIVGILFAKDLVGHARGDLLRRPLVEMLHPPLFVPRRAKADRLFREFQRRKTHMALVVDEYGRLSGLVTMEDLLLSLFGGLSESHPRPALSPAESPLPGNQDGQ